MAGSVGINSFNLFGFQITMIVYFTFSRTNILYNDSVLKTPSSLERLPFFRDQRACLKWTPAPPPPQRATSMPERRPVPSLGCCGRSRAESADKTNGGGRADESAAPSAIAAWPGYSTGTAPCLVTQARKALPLPQGAGACGDRAHRCGGGTRGLPATTIRGL